MIKSYFILFIWAPCMVWAACGWAAPRSGIKLQSKLVQATDMHIFEAMMSDALKVVNENGELVSVQFSTTLAPNQMPMPPDREVPHYAALIIFKAPELKPLQGSGH